MQLAVGLLASTALPMAAFAASNIASDLQQPLWYQEPSAKTLELAKIDDLSNTVVSDGQRGEKGVLGS
jgi:ribose transport system substrate-binding protein